MGVVYPKSVKENISIEDKKALCEAFHVIEAVLAKFQGNKDKME